MKPLQIYIGYDKHEVLAFHVLSHSILRRASRPVTITPLIRSQLQECHTRERNPYASTDFAFTRFLTPYLADTNDFSIFMDCDFLCLCDIFELIENVKALPISDVYVVKHDYTPTTKTKFLHQPQTIYPCKNWSSMMVFNGMRQPVQNLTPAYVDSAAGLDLHQFKWAKEIGNLPTCYNHLVGEYAPNPFAKLIHYTIGGPWFWEYSNCEYGEEWFQELGDLLSTCNSILPFERLKQVVSAPLKPISRRRGEPEIPVTPPSSVKWPQLPIPSEELPCQPTANSKIASTVTISTEPTCPPKPSEQSLLPSVTTNDNDSVSMKRQPRLLRVPGKATS